MRLLLFSDLHADRPAAVALARAAAAADLLVGAGDFINGRDTSRFPDCLDVLRGTGKPAVLVPGNNESADELTDACRGWPGCHVLHGAAASVDGITFYGVGGGIPVTPFGSWSYDFDEQQGTALLAAAPSGCVLVVHSPPKGVVDVSSRGGSIGSTAIRDAVLRVRPRLVVCGHVHGSNGTTGELAGVPVVNAGPRGVTWELANA
ncbi:metallophosphoesterase family protein [Urbifossiella limnaea]|uniref:Calcineurin-like phosphoesterase superfamily domain protein n=1 Tax=Urbifossiella limnaea TaxID=2528023 RepID=A0A517XYW3_9BACT|nr:metallophosphoesterase [Urbifossiella limnaea]QDU22707.1 Calcineurin-like phosphoesterase superfamily domain protein [Urbifossiella limnaea]